MTLLPLCMFLGAAFQRAADLGMRHGRTLARAYAVECAGSVFGGLLSALMLYWGIQNMTPGHCLRCHYDGEPRSWPWSNPGQSPQPGQALS